MDNGKEIKFFVEDTTKQDIAALFCIKLIHNDKQTITGDTPSHITEVTAIPSEGFTPEQQERIRILLEQMTEVFREVILATED